MIHLKNILVPVDFSKPSQSALEYGLAIAGSFRAQVAVAHVVPSMAAFGDSLPGGTADLDRLALDSARRTLQDFVTPLCRERTDVRTILKTGDIRNELLGIIDAEKMDLVVMGSHGRRNIERFILGSTTEHILRNVPVPILTVSHAPAPAAIRSIVYAADLSRSTEIGLRYTAALARALGARLKLVHAIDPLETGQWGIEFAGALPFDLGLIQEKAMDRLRSVMIAEHVTNIPCEAAVVTGISHSAIVTFAEESKADLLVLNLQSKGVLERVMLGATAERVVRTSHIPVLSIPVGTASRFMDSQ